MGKINLGKCTHCENDVECEIFESNEMGKRIFVPIENNKYVCWSCAEQLNIDTICKINLD